MKTMTNGMLGLIVGDALGVPVEFLSKEQILNRPNGKVTDMEGNGTFHLPEGSWSDDSSMALATLDSIQSCGGIHLQDIMEKFVLWIEKGAYTPFGQAFDIGRTCNEAIFNFTTNHDPFLCGKTGEYANGNGALMRILPVCVYWCEKQSETEKDLTAEAIKSIEQVAALTHNHKRSGIACGIYYFIIKQLHTALEDDALNTLIQQGVEEAFRFYAKDKEAVSELEEYDELLDIETFAEYQESELSPSGYVVDSMLSAIWCLVTTSTYKDCVLKAVNMGEDTDTIAAIAGGLAGIYYGADTIPVSWIEKLQGKESLKILF